MIEGRLTDSLFFDNRVLANDCAEMVDTYLKGEKPEISDYEQYDNGTKIVGTVTSDIQLIDKDNYQMLVDDGYYDEDEIMLEATSTPTPKPTVTEEPSEDEKDITPRQLRLIPETKIRKQQIHLHPHLLRKRRKVPKHK